MVESKSHHYSLKGGAASAPVLAKEEDLTEVTCLICQSIVDCGNVATPPSRIKGCGHLFCGECLSNFVSSSSGKKL